jgi:hypothetical protein
MTPILTLLLFGAPAAAFWLLVAGLDPIGRLVMAGLAGMVIVSGVGGVMLIFGLWSPLGGLEAVLALSGLMILLSRLQRRRTTPARPPVDQTRPDGLPLPDTVGKSAGSPPSLADEGDEWLFEP